MKLERRSSDRDFFGKKSVPAKKPKKLHTHPVFISEWVSQALFLPAGLSWPNIRQETLPLVLLILKNIEKNFLHCGDDVFASRPY